MSELFWPGAHRAAGLFGDRAFLEAMVAVESAWLGAELTVPEVELDVEAGGNPVTRWWRRCASRLTGSTRG